jgi:hypothetical protein
LFINLKCILLNDFDKENVYYFLIKHENFKQKTFDLLRQNNNNLFLMYICDKNEKIIKSTPDYLINLEPEIISNISNIDKLKIALNLMNNNVVPKNINNIGYFIKHQDTDKTYKIYIIKTNIYKYISSFFLKYENQHKNYLDLYQANKLTEILPYLHKYPADIIRRINTSVKVIAKNILNIYHLTRKKQNEKLYNCLTDSYKKVLFDLHKIYVDQKNMENKGYYNEMFKEKKSISVEIVYNYLKNINNSELIKLFYERIKLMTDLKNLNYDMYSKIIFVDNIDISVQTTLMFGEI